MIVRDRAGLSGDDLAGIPVGRNYQGGAALIAAISRGGWQGRVQLLRWGEGKVGQLCNDVARIQWKGEQLQQDSQDGLKDHCTLCVCKLCGSVAA